MQTKKLSLADFKLSVQQDSKKMEDLMGGLVLAGCHPTSACITGPNGNSDPDTCTGSPYG